MVELMKNIYTFPIPLKNSPLKWINCYLIKGERGLLVDTAFNQPESEQAILDALSTLGMSIEETDLFITHMHVDHSGLVERLKRPQNHVYASRTTAQMIDRFQQPEHWDWIVRNNLYTGTPKEEALPYNEHIAYSNRPAKTIEFSIVAPGDHLSVGEYDFEVYDLEGHAPGQTGLYDAKKGILFCGDHILGKITPNITAWDLEKDYLAIFLKNLDRVDALGLQHLYTAHRELPEDISKRISELKMHHAQRLDEVREIIHKHGSGVTAYEVAKEMTWSIKKGFLDFPKTQKWFACSEALAHLQHLYFIGELKVEREGDLLRYSFQS